MIKIKVEYKKVLKLVFYEDEIEHITVLVKALANEDVNFFSSLTAFNEKASMKLMEFVKELSFFEVENDKNK